MRIKRSCSVSAGDSRGLAFNILAKDREPIVTRSTKCNVPVITALHETRASVTVIPVQPRYNGRYGYTGASFTPAEVAPGGIIAALALMAQGCNHGN